MGGDAPGVLIVGAIEPDGRDGIWRSLFVWGNAAMIQSKQGAAARGSLDIGPLS
jgi:hypothetical protein